MKRRTNSADFTLELTFATRVNHHVDLMMITEHPVTKGTCIVTALLTIFFC